MNTFRVESVQIKAAFDKVFAYIAASETLPMWTHAFKSVRDGTAILATPAGTVEIGLRVNPCRDQGTIDWFMKFPNGSEADWFMKFPNGSEAAYSRLVPEAQETCVYSFVLLGPPVPLAQLECALDQQAKILREELKRLQQILEAPSRSVGYDGRNREESAAG